MCPARSTSRMRNGKRGRSGNEKLVARLAVPRHHDRHVENIRASTSLSPCVQRKIWVKISPLGRGGCQFSLPLRSIDDYQTALNDRVHACFSSRPLGRNSAGSTYESSSG